MILLDTSGLLAALDSGHHHHAAAAPVLRSLEVGLPCSSFVVGSGDQRTDAQLGERDRRDHRDNFGPLPFDTAAAPAFGGAAASLRKKGRKPSALAYDAMIASVAIANGLLLYTCDPDGFAGIDGLVVVPVPHPSASRRRIHEPGGRISS